MGKPSERPMDRLNLRRYDGKTVRVQVLLRPAEASKLRLVAAALGLDLGDVVTVGLLPVLAKVRTHVSVHDGPADDVPAGQGDKGPDLRAVG
jgi:hypothetical protein